MDNDLLFENIDEKIEDGCGLVTVNWISSNFDLGLEKSRSLLEEYLKTKENLSSVYILTGLSKEGDDVLIKLVRSDELNEVQSQFASKPTKTIYSIQTHPLKNSSDLSNFNSLIKLDVECLKRLTTIAWDPVKTSPIKVTSSVTTPLPTSPLIPKVEQKGRDDRIKTKSFQNFFTKPESIVSNAKVNPKSPPKPLPKPAVEVEHQEDDLEEDIGVKSSSNQKRKRLVIESDDDEEDDNDNEVEPIKQAQIILPKLEKTPKSQYSGSSKSPVKKQKHVISDQTISRHKAAKSPTKSSTKLEENSPVRKDSKKILVADSDTDSPVAKSSKTTPRASRTKPAQLDSPSWTSSTTSSSTPGSVRCQVMKTFADEEGFMVTERVWDTVPTENNDHHKDQVDQEGEEEAQTNVQTKPLVESNNRNLLQPKENNLTGLPTVTQPKPNKPNPTTKKIKQSTKQASIASFFKPAA